MGQSTSHTMNVEVSGVVKKSVTVDKKELADLVDGCTQYPSVNDLKKEGLRMDDHHMVVLHYTCTNSKCFFDDAIAELTRGPKADALKWDDELEILKEIVLLISNSPTIFPSVDVCGFVIHSLGKPLLYLRNKSKTHAPRVGLVDHFALRKKLYFKYMNKSNNDWIQSAVVVFILSVVFLLLLQFHPVTMQNK